MTAGLGLICVFDCESTGLRRDHLPSDDPAQPRLLQISAKLVDENKRRRGRLTAIIRPDGWSIEPEAEAVHGISERTANRSGIKATGPLAVLAGFVSQATTVVAHNFEFDWWIVKNALTRNGSQGEWWQAIRVKRFCTMESATPIINKPGQFGTPSFVSLAAAHDFFMPEQAPYVSRHDAEEDVDACERIYWAIKERSAA